jgi:hypothetical protein
MTTPRLLIALMAVTVVLPSLAQADYYSNPKGSSGVEHMRHYPMQHHEAPQVATPKYQAPAAHPHVQHHAAAPNHAYTPTPSAYAPAASEEKHCGSACSESPTPNPVMHAGPDDFTGGVRYGAKVDAAAVQYKANHPDLFAPKTTTAPAMHHHQHATAPQGARFSSMPQKQLKLVDQQAPASTSPEVKSHARHTSLFSNVKTMRPYDANWSSTYLH